MEKKYSKNRLYNKKYSKIKYIRENMKVLLKANIFCIIICSIYLTIIIFE